MRGIFWLARLAGVCSIMAEAGGAAWMPRLAMDMLDIFPFSPEERRAIRFRREEYLEGHVAQDGTRLLTPEQVERIRANREEAQRRVLERAGPVVPAEMAPGWRLALATELCKPYFSRLIQFVEEDRKYFPVYPANGEVFTWAKLCDIQEVKVVILGLEASHCCGDQGLAFSRPRDVHLSIRLQTIYRELSASVPGFVPPTHGDLTGWARQGVLLLNEVQTVRQHRPGSHRHKGWERFTRAVLACLNRERHGLVFLLWGWRACLKANSINQRHAVLDAGPHNSPRGLEGCRHFTRANQLLEAFGKEPIDWGAF